LCLRWQKATVPRGTISADKGLGMLIMNTLYKVKHVSLKLLLSQT